MITTLSRIRVLLRGLLLFPYTRKTLADIFGDPWAYQHHTKRQLEQVLAQHRGGWLLEDAVLKGKAVSAVSELQRQKAITQITLRVSRLCVCWKRCVLLRTWPWGHEHFCGPPGNNMHGLSATFMLQT